MALCWAAFSAFYVLLSSHMTNKDDDNDDDLAMLDFWDCPSHSHAFERSRQRQRAIDGVSENATLVVGEWS